MSETLGDLIGEIHEGAGLLSTIDSRTTALSDALREEINKLHECKESLQAADQLGNHENSLRVHSIQLSMQEGNN